MGNTNEHITILDLNEIKKYNQPNIKYLLYPIDNKEMITINLNKKFYFNDLSLKNLPIYTPDQSYLISDDINLLFIKEINKDTNKIHIIIKSSIQPTTNTYFFIKNVLLNNHEFNNELTNYTATLDVNYNTYDLNIYYINSHKPLKYYIHSILNNIDNKIFGGNSLNYNYNNFKRKYNLF